MPSLAGLLIVVGVGTIKPSRVMSVARTGTVPLTVMVITLVLTMVIPLQYSVLVGVGISVLMFVVGQSSRLVMKRLVAHPDGAWEQVEPPGSVGVDEVIVLQPYGSLSFVTAQALAEQLPEPTDDSRGSVVILRIRGADDAGSTMLDVLHRYAETLSDAECRLAVVTDSDRVERQLELTGVTELIGADGIYRSTAFLGQATRRAHDDAVEWINR
jgi:SulP family sulfate permease